MQPNDMIDRTGARIRTRRAGELAALAGAAVIAVAACTSSGAAGNGTVAGATTAPAAPAATTDLMGGGGYGGYGGGTTATEAPAASAAASSAALVVAAAKDAAVGSYLVGANGMTLYIFTKDSAGKSVCTDQCAVNWPPLAVGAGETVSAGTGVAGTFATTTRPDGTTQVTYNGAPLYYYAADKKAGDVVGQGVGGVWYVAAP